ncbi:MAG: hypothetical protein ACI85F_003023 [Bacteroidia bacterium]|jgi:hypothetical protein
MNKLLALVGLMLIVFVSHNIFKDSGDLKASPRFHSDFEIQNYADLALTTDSSFMFSGSGVCVECHGRDGDGLASVTLEGVDINVVDDWRATMMANSAKDPLWRAKVSHEILVNPGHQSALETKCTSCHAPMGHFQAMHDGQVNYSIAEMLSDPLALDGVSCLACHKQLPDSVGLNFSGELHYDTLKNAYGQYPSPLAGPMVGVTAYWPVQDDYISTSETCAGCHTLITNTVDLSGNLTGGEFVEQATYHEWLNSVYNDTLSCQGCHMPQYPDNVRLIAGYPGIPPRQNFSKHHFAGANVFMLKIMKEHRLELDIDASAAQFDSAISRTTDMLMLNSVDMDVEISSITLDTIFVDVELLNKAGHKFPSGYPSRRVVLEVVMLNATGDTIFQSGTLNDHFEAFGQDPTYEQHYDWIGSEADAQIYEMVMGDVNNDVTTTLERADHPIKDNRLVPIGFSTSHASYDTTILAGTVLADFNFNNNGMVGSGTDQISYHIPTGGYQGSFSVRARLLYQTLPPKWNDEMFSYNSAEIDTFRNMYNNADRTPIVVAEIVLNEGFVGLSASNKGKIELYPNPATHQISITLPTGSAFIKVYSISGKLMLEAQIDKHRTDLDVESLEIGIYVVEITSDEGTSVRRFVKN